MLNFNFFMQLFYDVGVVVIILLVLWLKRSQRRVHHATMALVDLLNERLSGQQRQINALKQPRRVREPINLYGDKDD